MVFKWAKQQLANVAGTEEPIYGPTAIRSVREEMNEKKYTELTRDHLKWEARHSTCVENQVFYIFSETGHVCMAQVIYSNVAGLHTTCQFNLKIFYKDTSKPHLWCSTPLSDVDFSSDRTGFYAKDCAVELTEDGMSYTIKSAVDERSIVNLTITRTAPGFQAGKTGTSLFGTDPKDPWGTMRHAFWPRCVATGTVTTKEGTMDFKGRALFIYALQGMKPHHAASRWNFVNFQGPTHSAILMEFTTPPSYGSTVVTVGCIAKDGEIVISDGASIVHTAVEDDPEVYWPAPEALKADWSGNDGQNKATEATMEIELGQRADRIDVMAEVPGFIKKLAETTAGTKPYIYQYLPKNATLKLKIGDQEITEGGDLFSEATFITGGEIRSARTSRDLSRSSREMSRTSHDIPRSSRDIPRASRDIPR